SARSPGCRGPRWPYGPAHGPERPYRRRPAVCLEVLSSAPLYCPVATSLPRLTTMTNPLSNNQLAELAEGIRARGAELGFGRIGITGIDLAEDEAHLERWLAQGRHGELDYMR